MSRWTLSAALAAAVCLIGSGIRAGAQPAPGDRVGYLGQGKEVFERACGVCHTLDRPLSKTFDRDGWERVVERMHDNGAEATREERAQVVAYLFAKNTFEARCSACHGTDRALGVSKPASGWLATVQRMAGKKPGHLTEAEVAEIAAYLAVVRPAQP